MVMGSKLPSAIAVAIVGGISLMISQEKKNEHFFMSNFHFITCIIISTNVIGNFLDLDSRHRNAISPASVKMFR